jgi:uncharacterized damage-inducible protein DinB
MDPVTEAFQHHLWATRRLMDHMLSLPESAMMATAPGVYGDVQATLSHLLDADGRYLRYLEGNRPPAKTGPDSRKVFEKLREQLELQTARWQALLPNIGAIDIDLPARGDRPMLPHAANLLLVQALHHGNDHRTEICTVLTTNGYKAPTLDVWAYWMDSHVK